MPESLQGKRPGAPDNTFRWLLHLGAAGPLPTDVPRAIHMGDGSPTPLALTSSGLYVGGEPVLTAGQAAELYAPLGAGGEFTLTAAAAGGSVAMFDLAAIPTSWREDDTDITMVQGGSKVMSIGADAFSGCTALASASFPSVEVVGASAFQGCMALTGASFETADAIQANAFQGCGSLGSIHAPRVRIIGSAAFNSTALAAAIFPMLDTVGATAFTNYALSAASVPALVSIDTQAFQGTFLASIALPSALAIGVQAFEGCFLLTDAYLNLIPGSIDTNAFADSALTTIHLRPAPHTPEGWTLGSGQTIGGKTGVTVAADWTTFPDLP